MLAARLRVQWVQFPLSRYGERKMEIKKENARDGERDINEPDVENLYARIRAYRDAEEDIVKSADPQRILCMSRDAEDISRDAVRLCADEWQRVWGDRIELPQRRRYGDVDLRRDGGSVSMLTISGMEMAELHEVVLNTKRNQCGEYYNHFQTIYDCDDGSVVVQHWYTPRHMLHEERGTRITLTFGGDAE